MEENAAKTDRMRWAYQTMTAGLMEGSRMPGVKYAYNDGKCLEILNKMRDAYDRLCERLGVQDEDADVETIIYAFEEIQEELCYRMYRYGAEFGL